MDGSHWRGAHARPWLWSQRELGTVVGKLSIPLCPIKSLAELPLILPGSPWRGTSVSSPATAQARWWVFPGHQVL